MIVIIIFKKAIIVTTTWYAQPVIHFIGIMDWNEGRVETFGEESVMRYSKRAYHYFQINYYY